MPVRFLRGDCLTHLRRLPDASVDATVTDPPYGIDLAQQYRGRRHVIRNDRPARARWLWEQFLPEVARAARPDTAHLFFGTWKSIWMRELLDEHFTVKGCIVWYKNTWGLGWHLRPRWELIWYCHKGKPPVPELAPPDVWEHARDHRPAHPCQKPVDLLRRAIRLVAPRGGLILDPFAGIASTGVAAVGEGCSFLGFEISPKHHRLGRRRLAEAVKMARFARAARFAAPPSNPLQTPVEAESKARPSNLPRPAPRPVQPRH